MKDTNQTQPKLVCREFGFEIILRRDQVPVVTRFIFPRVYQWKDSRNLPFSIVRVRAKQKARALFRIGLLSMSVDLGQQFFCELQNHFPSHKLLSLKYL